MSELDLTRCSEVDDGVHGSLGVRGKAACRF